MRNPDLKQARELEHPIRFRIWELYEQNQGRSLVPRDLLRDMADMEETPSLSQVNYHLRQLQHVGLVPQRGKK